MKFKIGNLEVQTEPALGTMLHSQVLSMQPAAIGRKPRHVYTWECFLAPDRNPTPPRYFVADVNLSLVVLTASGKVNNAATRRVALRLLQASGAANLTALDTLLTAQLKPRMIKIPWGRLSTYFSRRSRVTVLAWLGYKDMILRPTAGPTQDTYILSYPTTVRFVAVVSGYCEVTGPGAGILIGTKDKSTSLTLTPGSGVATDFETDFDDALRDRTLEDPTGTRKLLARIKADAERRQGRYHDRVRAEHPEDDW